MARFSFSGNFCDCTIFSLAQMRVFSARGVAQFPLTLKHTYAILDKRFAQWKHRDSSYVSHHGTLAGRRVGLQPATSSQRAIPRPAPQDANADPPTLELTSLPGHLLLQHA